MPINILMPALSPTMTEGKLAKWHVAEGDAVEAGDVIAEIETDKATMEVEAVDEGKIGKIIVTEGTDAVTVNEPIAVLLEEGEDESALKDFDVKSSGDQSAPKEDKKEDDDTADQSRTLRRRKICRKRQNQRTMTAAANVFSPALWPNGLPRKKGLIFLL